MIASRLANAADLRLEQFPGGLALLPQYSAYADTHTPQALLAMGWPRLKEQRGGVGVPDDAISVVQAYLDAGTGPEAISTKMPLLVWLVFMQHITSKQLLDALSRTISGSGAMQAMFADSWCREILLQYLPELREKKEAAPIPNEQITLYTEAGAVGVEADSFCMGCIAGRIRAQAINARTFEAGYGTLSDLLMRWKGSNAYDGADQLVRDTLFQLISSWGKEMQDGGTVNRTLAKRLFRAMGGLIRRDD